MTLYKRTTLDPFGIGHKPSDEAVRKATERYVEQGRREGITPSPEWEAAHPQKREEGKC